MLISAGLEPSMAYKKGSLCYGSKLLLRRIDMRRSKEIRMTFNKRHNFINPSMPRRKNGEIT